MGRDGDSYERVFDTLDEAKKWIEKRKEQNNEDLDTVNTRYDCGHDGFESTYVKHLGRIAKSKDSAREICHKHDEEITCLGDNYPRWDDNYLHLITKEFEEEKPVLLSQEEQDELDRIEKEIFDNYNKLVALRENLRKKDVKMRKCLQCKSIICHKKWIEEGICPACDKENISLRVLKHPGDPREKELFLKLFNWKYSWHEKNISLRSVLGEEDMQLYNAIKESYSKLQSMCNGSVKYYKTGKTKFLLYESTCTGHY